nr:hypothetical transcript [Hymenolepis microstoma]
MWGEEKYNYEGNACSTAQTKANDDSCKHYIQVVWAKAMKVGCAKKGMHKAKWQFSFEGRRNSLNALSNTKVGEEKYDYDKKVCATAQKKANDDSCKHYIQVVWAKAMKVGCAKITRQSDGNSKADSTVSMLCLYGQGSKGQNAQPYTKGEGGSCKKCSPEYLLCDSKL